MIDAEHVREMGVIVFADGVAVENLTARDALSNGIYWRGVTGFRGSYLTAVGNVGNDVDRTVPAGLQATQRCEGARVPRLGLGPTFVLAGHTASRPEIADLVARVSAQPEPGPQEPLPGAAEAEVRPAHDVFAGVDLSTPTRSSGLRGTGSRAGGRGRRDLRAGLRARPEHSRHAVGWRRRSREEGSFVTGRRWAPLARSARPGRFRLPRHSPSHKSRTTMQYNTGLLVGRAFALANGSAGDRQRLAAELCTLADGDRMALVLAQARYREFLAERAGCPEEARALALLDAALERFDSLCAA